MEIKIKSELLKKFKQKPGLMTTVEHCLVKDFLEGYQKIRDAYREAFGVDPIGLTLESNIESSDWYIKFSKKNNIK